jgi:DNA replication protein DnaC
VGKTHLAISLAITAAEWGRRVYYSTLSDLVLSLVISLWSKVFGVILEFRLQVVSKRDVFDTLAIYLHFLQ